MRKIGVLPLLLALLAIACIAPLQTIHAFPFFHHEKKAALPVQNAKATALYNKAQQDVANGDVKRAQGVYREIVKRYPKTDVADKAQFDIAQYYDKRGDQHNAFEAYDAYLKNYPRGENFDVAVAAEFKIGNLYMEGKKKHVLGFLLTPSASLAKKVFASITANAPYSKYAPPSQFNMGLAEERLGKYADAISAYQTVLDKYPESDVADDAEYQIAYVYFFQVYRGSYDPEVKEKAIQTFEDFLVRFPNSEKAAQAKENLKKLNGTENKSILHIAQFYDKQKKYKAAVIYYNQVIRQYPGTPESKIASARVNALKKKVGAAALQPAEPTTGSHAQSNRKLRAQTDTASRPDFNGPPITVPDKVAPKKPALRTSPDDVGPVHNVAPPLPVAEPAAQ